jgi:hypothetical protein
MSPEKCPRQTRGPANAKRAAFRKDVTAGFINAVVSVPDGLASAALGCVSPHTGFIQVSQRRSGSLLVSAELMQVSDNERFGGGWPGGCKLSS